MNTYTVELRRGAETKTVTITCKPNQVIGAIYENYPDYKIVRYY